MNLTWFKKRKQQKTRVNIQVDKRKRFPSRHRQKEHLKLDFLRPEPTSWRVCSGSTYEQLQHGTQTHHSLVHRPGQQLPRPQTHRAALKFFIGSDCFDFWLGSLCLVWFCAAVVAGEFKAVSLHFLKSRNVEGLRCDTDWDTLQWPLTLSKNKRRLRENGWMGSCDIIPDTPDRSDRHHQTMKDEDGAMTSSLYHSPSRAASVWRPSICRNVFFFF